MAQTYEVGVVIGASLSSAYKNAFKTAQEKAQDLKKSLAKAEIGASVGASLEKYKNELRELRSQQRRGEISSEEFSRRVTEIGRAYRKAARQAKDYGMSVGEAISRQDEFARSAERSQRAVQRGEARQRNQDARSEMHGQAMGMAGTAIALAAPIREAVQFESAMADVKKVVDFDSPKQFKQMGKDLLQLSTRIPMSAEGLADIAAAAGQSNIAREDIRQFTAQAAKLGVAFDMTGKQAGKVMANWRAGMGLTQKRVVSLADATNYLSNNMNAEAGALAEVIQRQGAVAMQAGLAESQVAALGSAMLSSGAGPERAATALKNFTGALTKGESATSRQREAYQKLGLEAEQVAKGMQEDAEGTIREVLQRMSKAPKYKRSSMVTDLFGEESKGAIMPLLANMEDLDKAFALVADKGKYAGSMQREFEERANTTANTLDLMVNKLSRAGVTIGSVLLPPLNSVAGVIGGAINKFASFAEEQQGLTRVAIGLAASLAMLKIGMFGVRYAATLVSDAVQMGRAVFDFFKYSVTKANVALVRQQAVAVGYAAKQWTVAAATKAWTAAQWLLNAAMNANPIGLVVAGVVALGAAAYYVIKHWDKVKAFFGTVWDWISSPFQRAWNWLSGLDWSSIGKGIVSTLMSGFMNFTPLGWIIQGFQEVKSWLSGFSLQSAGQAILNTLVSGIKSVAGKAYKAVKDSLGFMGKLMPGSDAKEGPLSRLTAAGKAIPETIGQGVRRSAPALKRATQGALAGVALSTSVAGAQPVMDQTTARISPIMDRVPAVSDQEARAWISPVMGRMPQIPDQEATARIFPMMDRVPAVQGGDGAALREARVFKDLLRREAPDREPSSSKQVVINFSPTINVSGSSDSEQTAQAVQSALDGELARLKNQITQIVHDERRLRYD